MSIYESIGGEAALAAVVDDLYERILADEMLSAFFVGTNLNKLKGRQIEFFGQALGGPMVYQGGTMKDVHRGLGIERAHLDRVAEHLVASLAAAGVPEETIAEIAAVVMPLADDIVSGKATPEAVAAEWAPMRAAATLNDPRRVAHPVQGPLLTQPPDQRRSGRPRPPLPCRTRPDEAG
jgi:hemoglobin